MTVSRVTAPEMAQRGHMETDTMIPKQGRERDDGFLEYLKTLPQWRCIFLGTPSPDPHHLQTRGAGGSDYMVIPMDHSMHRELHQLGARFWDPYRLRCLWEWGYHLPAIVAQYRRERNYDQTTKGANAADSDLLEDGGNGFEASA